MTVKRLWLLVCLMPLAGTAWARPDLRLGRAAGPLVLYPDDTRPGLYHYPPGEIILANSADGSPELHFLQMRYTGNVVAADRGAAVFRSVLSFRVRLSGPTAEQIKAAGQALGGAPKRIELRPLPIRRLEAALVYASAGPGGESAEQSLPAGHFEGEAADESSAAAYWRERSYTLGLDAASSQLFWDALHKGQVVLSLAYAFYADGIPPDRPLAELTGSPKLVEALQGQIETEKKAAADEGTALVRAGATAIRVDARRWPELFRQVDVNETAPPGYAALDVYCYDFQNQLRPDLAEKQVEIEAEGVGGKPITLTALFRREQPDLYARGLRFPLAVRLDRPYRYRVTQVGADGGVAETAWQTRTSWSELLDVTSPPPKTKPPTSQENPR